MQVAEILSDLTSLQVCDPKAALALVSARPENADKAQNATSNGREDGEEDSKRAKELIALHASVKVAHEDGTDPELTKAREAVQEALRNL